MPLHSPSCSARARDRTRAGSGDSQARMARFYEQLREASNMLGDLHTHGRRPSLGCPSPRAEACSLEPKTVLQRSKYSFCDADMWCAMIKGYVESGDSWKAVNGETANRWQEAKMQNKELKTARIREEEVHAELQRSVAEAFEEAREAASMCSRQLDLLHSQQDVSDAEMGQHAGEGEDLDLCPPWANGPHGEAAEEAARGTDELSRIMSLREQESEKRHRLAEEVRRLEMELDRGKRRSEECENQHKQELDGADSLEKISKAQSELGFPDITFQDVCQLDETSRSTVILTGNAGASTDEAVRSLTVEFAKNGHLTRATPHPTLGLERDAAEAVSNDDLPSLLTKVWHRVCDGKRRRHSRGGA